MTLISICKNFCRAPASFGDFLVGIFTNPFKALSDGNFLSIIVFAIGFGLAVRVVIDTSTDERVVKGVRLMLDVISGAEKASFKLIEWVVLYFPIGVFALTLSNFAQNGTLLFGPYARITLAVVAALALGVNPILDMFETCCNVAGDNVCTYIVGKTHGLIEK